MVVWTGVGNDGGGVVWKRMVTFPDPEGSGRQPPQPPCDPDDVPHPPSDGGASRRNRSARSKSSFFRNR